MLTVALILDLHEERKRMVLCILEAIEENSRTLFTKYAPCSRYDTSCL